MKRILPLIAAGLVFFSPAVNVCYGQQTVDSDATSYEDDEMDDLDDLFAEAEDVEDAKETEPVVSTTSSSTGSSIKLNGSVSGDLGFMTQALPSFDITPYCSFSTSLGFTASPYSDLTIKGKATASFPSMEISVSTLYLDYILLGKAYISLGRTNTAWGNSQIFDTNILDDRKSDLYFNTQMLLSGVPCNASFFNAIATVPVGKGQIVALGSYESTKPDLSKDNMGAAFSIEYPVLGFSVNLFGKYFSNALTGQQKSPAIGLEVTGDIYDWHLTLWGELNENLTTMKTEYARTVCGISRFWQADPRMVLAAEYQFIYNNQDGQNDLRNDLGLKWAWSHVNGSQFSPSLQCWMNFENLCGSIIPGVTYTGIKHTQITLTAPVLFGDQTIQYKGASISSTAGMPTVLIGAVVSLSASF